VTNLIHRSFCTTSKGYTKANIDNNSPASGNPPGCYWSNHLNNSHSTCTSVLLEVFGRNMEM